MSTLKPASVGPYIITRILGEGTTGKVKLGYNKDTNQQVAIKIIPKSSFEQNKNLKNKVQREIALMRIVKHPNILQLIDVLESQRHLYIILEYAENGELFDFLVSRHSLPEELAIDFFRQMVFAIEYLHNHGICHRDLKPENILLDSSNRIKIADFGFARWVKKDMAETSCGSPHYAAPEVVKGIPYDGRRADVWSLGVILFALLAGYLPFDDVSIRNLLHKVKRGIFQMPPFPTDIQELITQMMNVDPKNRATIEQVKSFPAFRRGLSGDYVLPSPIPLLEDASPIDPSKISPEIIKILLQIGFSESSELFEQLQSPSNTMAKVFVAMLTAQLDLEQLPWDKSPCCSTVNPLGSNSFLMPQTTFFNIDDNDSFGRDQQQSRCMNSLNDVLSINSMARRPDWMVETTSINSVLTEINYEFMSIPIYDIMCRAEETADDCGIQWFHPDPVTMYFRTQDATFYCSLNLTLCSEEAVALYVKLHKGSPEQFKDFTDHLYHTITSI